MANEENWDKDFNWFDEEHFECIEVDAGSREALLESFHQIILVNHPYRDYGTSLRNIREDGNVWKATVRRFKTKELCAKHCTFPPTYVRTGEMMP